MPGVQIAAGNAIAKADGGVKRLRKGRGRGLLICTKHAPEETEKVISNRRTERPVDVKGISR